MAGRKKADVISELPKDWDKEVLDLYKEGASDVEVKALIYEWRGSFSNDLWSRLMNDNEVFSETIQLGRVLSQAWWERTGRTNLHNEYKGSTFNTGLWYANMKNRFGWKDKQDITTDNKPLQEFKIEIVDSNPQRK